MEEYISRRESTSPDRDAVVPSVPTWSAAYFKQTRISNRFLICLAMLCPPPAYPEIWINCSALSRQSKSKPVSQPICKGQGEAGREKAINTTFHRNTSINHVLFYGGNNKHCFTRILQSSAQKKIRTSAEEVKCKMFLRPQQLPHRERKSALIIFVRL